MNVDLLESYKGKTVLVTGHTGFKGSWLTLWLQALGAKVVGYSLLPSTRPSLFEAARVQEGVTHIIGDIRDQKHLYEVFNEHLPDIVFHLAAQPIVLRGYEQPVETFEVNASGTVNVLEAIRQCASVKAAVMVTSDKCYENIGSIWGYREIDELGGPDPYSASKAMAELAISSYRRSYFQNGPAVASVRAGNVIGGGDFSDHRIVPDTMRALSQGLPVRVRNPQSVRPWLHVLDPLHGYLALGARLLSNDGQAFVEAWNFGPLEQVGIGVQDIVERAIAAWGGGSWEQTSNSPKPEMALLRLNWDKAAHRLQWKPQYDWKQAIDETVLWFAQFRDSPDDMRAISLAHIDRYCAERMECGLVRRSSLTAKR